MVYAYVLRPPSHLAEGLWSSDTLESSHKHTHTHTHTHTHRLTLEPEMEDRARGLRTTPGWRGVFGIRRIRLRVGVGVGVRIRATVGVG